ncbi:LysR family transcriptional regulator [Photobacterium phosphoreum]|uniref:LysR family transcriptional regulator n=1 Tax=Photobacterium phosphoreum TaxID=659 RepID=UPI0007F90033|nr:LysR family transcriptional regulator [Photobacterium phosphoreum]MCD9475766.1 LysR family transcriptional regulator [Photobacterium phosphoreum]MCD9484228.1 LysR family transcriptional regulator [Photobacterium phosphoreum]MCF2176425.1 LysR family transcriptional regulator [Photobacterium phosphoreum]OBU39546.1 LysR family transcriptional regulator [Photobacterium phosphoreum]PSU77028.1 LysR family transcriptional regulator [Photobacterium phosphoreum]
MDWITCANSFITVVEHGSLAQAANKLNTSSSALSKRLSWLEKQLGVQLLKRTTRHLTVTDAGQLFYQRSVLLVNDWQQMLAETTATYGDVGGILRLGAPLATGSRLLVNYLAEFSQCYPKIKIELHTVTPGQVPNLNLDVFISSEITEFNSCSYIATKLLSYYNGFYAAPTYLKNNPPITTAEQLCQHNYLLFGDQDHQQDHIFEHNQRLRLQGNFITSNPEALVAGAVAGMGLILTSSQTIKRELDNGLLVPVLPTLKQPTNAIYAYYPKLNYHHVKTKLFIDFIKQKSALSIPTTPLFNPKK